MFRQFSRFYVALACLLVIVALWGLLASLSQAAPRSEAAVIHFHEPAAISHGAPMIGPGAVRVYYFPLWYNETRKTVP